MNDYRKGLNSEQLRVVLAEPGPVLVVAGAGTGKTRALTHRVAHLVASGSTSSRIMLTTFTNQAARSMVERIGSLGAPQSGMELCAAGTYHQLGHRLLREFCPHLGLHSDFALLDSDDSRALIQTVVKECKLDSLSASRFPVAKTLQRVVGLCVGLQQDVETVVRERFKRFWEQIPSIDRIVQRYVECKRAQHLVDFDDLLDGWLQLLKLPIGDEIRGRFDHILVDEYQDVNPLQAAISDEMARDHTSLTCVGDDAQSVYDFRGSDLRQMLDFRSRHPKATLLALTQNYRSSPQILTLANRCIAHNRVQHPKSLNPTRPAGFAPALVALRDVFQQAEFVGQRIEELLQKEGVPASEVGVLYRNHNQSLELQLELTRRGIAFRVRSGIRFFDQLHVKEILSFVRIMTQSRDGLAWMRVLQQFEGIGLKTAEALVIELAKLSETQSRADGLSQAGSRFGGVVESSICRLVKILRALERVPNRNPGTLLSLVRDEHFRSFVQNGLSQPEARLGDIERLVEFAGRYRDCTTMLTDIGLIGRIDDTKDTRTATADASEEQKVTLSSLHQSKGLEWGYVFILSLAGGYFPGPGVFRDPARMEEERRLFYVGVTRAATELYLLYPTTDDRPLQGGARGSIRVNRVSQFISELDHSPPVFERWQIDESPTP